MSTSLKMNTMTMSIITDTVETTMVRPSWVVRSVAEGP